MPSLTVSIDPSSSTTMPARRLQMHRIDASAGTAERQRLKTTHVESCRAVAFSPDGAALASGSADGGMDVMDTETGKACAGQSFAAYSLHGHNLSANARPSAFCAKGATRLRIAKLHSVPKPFSENLVYNRPSAQPQLKHRSPYIGIESQDLGVRMRFICRTAGDGAVCGAPGGGHQPAAVHVGHGAGLR